MDEGTGAASRRVIAVATVAPLWGIHYGADLEIAAQHLTDGDEVHLLTCHGGLTSCVANPTADRISCMLCRAIQRRAVTALGIEPTFVHTIPSVDARKTDVPDTLERLTGIGEGSSNAGRATVSSLVSFLREPEPDLGAHAELLRKMLAAATGTNAWIEERLRSIDADALYVFNGRFVNAMPAVAAARSLGIPVIAHEQNWNGSGFITRDSGSVHRLADFAELLERSRVQLPHDRAASSHAVQWFEGRRFPLGKARIHSFTDAQEPDLLPSGFDPGRRNIAVFVSSEDEFVALAEWRHSLAPTQEGAIQSIATHPQLDPGITLWVRVHPNLRGLDNAQTARLHELSSVGFANVRVIPADSPVDTYSLVDAADIVVTFGSTIGAEALYWGTPVVLLGRAIYESIPEVVTPATLDEAIQIINEGLPLPDRSAALPFGAMVTESGHRYERFASPNSKHPGSFDGHSLEPGVIVKAVAKTAFVARRLWRRLTR